jgi:hypothetical protein
MEFKTIAYPKNQTIQLSSIKSIAATAEGKIMRALVLK